MYLELARYIEDQKKNFSVDDLSFDISIYRVDVDHPLLCTVIELA